MASTAGESFWEVHDAFRKRDNYMEVFLSTVNKIASEVYLGHINTCLAIAPGDGMCEIRFIEKCATNITKFIAVEQDQTSVEHLQANLRKYLPDVEILVDETDFGSWKGPASPVDLILMFHVLYYHRPIERKAFLSKLHHSWLAAGGFAVVVSTSHTKSPGNSCLLYERLGTPVVTWENIESDLLEVGFSKQHVYEIQFKKDFSNPDESFLRFYQLHVDQPVTLDDVRNAMQELFPDGKTDKCFYKLAVFQKNALAATVMRYGAFVADFHETLLLSP